MRKFTWETEVALQPYKDRSFPEMKIASQGQKAPKSAPPTADLPRTTSGNIDPSALRADLANLLRESRSLRRAK